MLNKQQIENIIDILEEYHCKNVHQYNTINNIISILTFVIGGHKPATNNAQTYTYADILNRILEEYNGQD